MGLLIRGEFTDDERRFIEVDLAIKELRTWVASLDELEEGDDEPGTYFEQGNQVLGYAGGLLKVLDKEKGDWLRSVEEKAFEEREDKESNDYRFTIEQVETIYNLIRDLPEKMKEIVDHFMEIRPEKRALVKQVAPELFRFRDDKNAWSLYPHDQIGQLVKFFELALKKRREIVVA